jgi:hypothetical protein
VNYKEMSSILAAQLRPSYMTYLVLNSRGLKLIDKSAIGSTDPVLLNVYGAPALIPRTEFRQPM